MSDAATAPASTAQPSRVGRLLNLVRKLVEYGKELAATLRQPGAATDLDATTRAFGTRDIALILARITRGLMMAHALEERLVRNARRLDAPPKPRPAPAPAKPASAPCSPDAAQAAPRLDRLPTAEQIAAEVRRRPIGVVIADICRDLGIRPSHPLWPELSSLIIRHCGSLARLVKDILDRILPFAIPDDAPAMTPPPVSTGPP